MSESYAPAVSPARRVPANGRGGRNPSKPSRRVRYAVEYLLVLGLARLVRLVSRRGLARLAGWLGGIAFHILRIRRKIVLENLRTAFCGEKDQREIERIARGVYTHFALTLAEICRMPLIAGGDGALLEQIVEAGGLDELGRALAEGRGAILLSGHLGSWELGAAVVAHSLGHFKVVAAPMKNPMVDAFLVRCRRSAGIEPIAPGISMRQVVKAVRNGEAVGFLADQDAGPSGLMPEFFGRPASTATGPAAIAIRWHVPIFLSFSVRLADGRHRLTLEKVEPPEPNAPGGRDQSIDWIMRRYTIRLEEVVREQPEQWLWLHRRWKSGGKAVPRDCR